MSHGGLSANEKEEKFAANDSIHYLTDDNAFLMIGIYLILFFFSLGHVPQKHFNSNQSTSEFT